MKRALRVVVAAALAAGALVVLAPVAPRALEAFRAGGAAVSFCADSLAGAAPGTWVRLSRCGVDMFHAGFLTDAQGVPAFRLVPLRPAGGDAAMPSALALAVPVASAGCLEVFRSRPAGHSTYSRIADLDDTIAVVDRRLDPAVDRLAQVPGFETGLAPTATVIEVRPIVPLRAHATRALIAAGLLTVATLVFFIGGTGETRAGETERRPVRWGLVCVTVLVGTIGLARWLQWQVDPIRTATADTPVPAMPAAPPEYAPPSPSAPVATGAELALLTSADPGNQLRGAKLLRTRARTPALTDAVDRALRNRLDPEVESELVCARAQFDDADSLEFLLGRVPADERAYSGRSRQASLCVVDALVRRITEAPERISAALMPAIFAADASVRHRTLAAFRVIDVPIPAGLAMQAAWPSDRYRAEALAAVAALGGVAKQPAIIEEAFRDREHRIPLRAELRDNPHPHAARIVAAAWIDLADADVEQIARQRETSQHDVSAALLETVLDETKPEARRAAAAARIGALGEVGAIHELRRLTQDAPDGALKVAAAAAIEALAKQQAAGVPARMRALPPR